MGFASQRRHLLPPPHTRRPAARSFCGGVTAFPREGETAPRTESPQCSTERCKKGRRVWQMGGRGGGSGSSVSKVSCRWEAKDCGGRQRACVSTRPSALLSAALPSSARCSLLLLPPSCWSISERASAAYPAGVRCFSGLSPAIGVREGGWGAPVRGFCSITLRTPLALFSLPKGFTDKGF